MHTNYAPPPPPPPPLPTYYSDGQTYVNTAPPSPSPPPPPPPRDVNLSTTSPQYHSSGSSYVPMPSRSLESGYPPRDPRYVQALPSLQYGQLAHQSPSPYIATGAYSNGGLGDDQNDRNRHGRNHFQDNNPPAGGGQPNGHDRIDDGDETQALPRYYFPPDGG
ncbi:hypothetical protein AA0116_g11130 [Alternaria tenuissima]|nr:hypothetical protein AA0116_g11130 [Alternaria tenuissima]